MGKLFDKIRGIPIIIITLAIIMIMAACATTEQQNDVNFDGNVTEVEASILRLSVGAAMSAMPETIAPAYAVSTAMMQQDLDQAITLANLDDKIAYEVSKLNLTPDEAILFMELTDTIKAGIKARLDIQTLPQEYNYGVLIKAVIEAVNAAARDRLKT